MSDEWHEGEIAGFASEYDADGLLAFSGAYANGVREGCGTMYYPEGSYLEGIWEEGALSEQPSRYFYPDKSSLRGTWVVRIAMNH